MSGNLNFNGIFKQKICKFCGKEFIVNVPCNQYLYKKSVSNGYLYFCSDKCKREWEKRRKEENGKKRKSRDYKAA